MNGEVMSEKKEVYLKIDYGECYKNNFKYDVEKALKFYLAQGEEFKYSVDSYGGFVLYPQALNPFLKIMETLGESQNIIILPGYNNDGDIINAPAYVIIKARFAVTKLVSDYD
jgi:hypothetical protein